MEWWSSNAAGLIGGIGGSVIGICGALIGVFGSRWAPAGKHKGLILGAMMSFVAIGAVLLLAGVVGVLSGQPYHVWYPLVLSGLMLTVVMGCLLPVMRLRYRQAEQRRLGAEEFRRSSAADG